MSIFDGRQDFLNIRFPTLGGEYCWDLLDMHKGYKLQRNEFTHHCRILNPHNIRIAWGPEGPMRAKFEEIKGTRRVTKGDVIGVHRINGLYDHYGVYESDDCVYEYGIGDNVTADIHVTTLSKFLAEETGYFILIFPDECGVPGKLDVGFIDYTFEGIHSHNLVDSFLYSKLKKEKYGKQYRLYSPEETIQRAKSRLGESNYNLLTCNCEHFAIWCKTGIAYSEQVSQATGYPGY